MSLQRIIPWLLVLLAASIVGMMSAVSAGLHAPAAAFAAAFAAAAIVAALRINGMTPHTGKLDSTSPPTAADTARRNARLVAIIYAWAGLAMQGVYLTPLTGLRWQHAWEYALAFALLAAGAFFYARALQVERDAVRLQALLRRAPQLAAVQAVIAALGLVYLLGAGKLNSMRPDWASNYVFVFAAAAILVASALSLRGHARSATPAE